MLHQVVTGGEATWSSDQLLVLDRNGYPEECYFTYSYSPVVAPGGDVAGVFCAVSETTDRVLGERRLRTLAAMARLVGSDDRDLVVQRATTVLEGNVGDHPLALVADVDPKGPRSALAEMLSERLPTVEPSTRARLADLLRQAASTGREHRIPTDPDPRLRHLVAWHARAVVEPSDAVRSGPRAVLLLAESSMRPWDDGLRSYAELCATHVAGALAGVARLEEERRRTEALAALDQAKSEFFTTVSHELRTPLTLISDAAQDAPADPAGAAAPARAGRAEHPATHPPRRRPARLRPHGLGPDGARRGARRPGAADAGPRGGLLPGRRACRPHLRRPLRGPARTGRRGPGDVRAGGAEPVEQRAEVHP